jgi:integrase
MKLKLPKYVQAVRKGDVYHYYYRRGSFRTKLAGRPFSTPFEDAYAAAEAAYEAGEGAPSTIGLSKLKPGSFAALIQTYYRSSDFLNLRPVSQQGNRNLMERIRKQLGDFMVADFQRRHMEKIMADYADKAATANRFRRMFKMLMRFAIAQGLRTDDPTATVKKLKVRTEGYKTWGEDEIAQFYERHPEGSRARLALDLILYTGQRRTDIVAMGRQHVRDDVVAVKQSKGDAVVHIPLHPRLKETLDAVPRDNLTFLLTDKGKPFTPAGFGNYMRDCVEEAGLRLGLKKGEKGFSSHGLRKAMCRRLADAGCDAITIMSITGHRNIQEVMTYIVERDRRLAAKRAIDSLDKYQVAG